MNHMILNSLEKPAIYTKTNVKFWDDPYISGQMLKAHLDLDFDGASRKLDFIEKSAAWIKQLVPPSDYPSLLDVGCGPGIYAERFAKAGYQVTGIDFSKRSIDYARQSADSNNLDITYYYQNYLEMDLDSCYDFACMIYCDYGALSTEDRHTIMNKLFQHLKPGGKLLLDVYSMKRFHNFKEEQTWAMHHKGGFWRPDEYLELNGSYKYQNNVTLRMTSIVCDNETTLYYLWDTYFTIKTLSQEAQSSGFKVCEIYGDVSGSKFKEDNDTIAILLERP